MAREIKTIKNSLYSRVLIEPWITEATTQAAELNKYVFKVAKEASKKNIKKAVETIYKVTVMSVNTVNIHRKKRIRGKYMGWKPGYKKAMVTLKEGDNIEFFKGK